MFDEGVAAMVISAVVKLWQRRFETGREEGARGLHGVLFWGFFESFHPWVCIVYITMGMNVLGGEFVKRRGRET